MARTSSIANVVCGVLVLGCVERELGVGGETETGGETTASGGESGASGATTAASGDPSTPTGEVATGSPGTSTGADPSTGGTSGDTDFVFIVDPDGGGLDCDFYAQDCPEGQKCMPWAHDGGSTWNATKCVEIMGDQGPGEVCKAEGGGLSGEDDCIEGAMCWDVNAENVGICAWLCMGAVDAPTCMEGFSCAVFSEGVVNICYPACDALLQDCPGGDLCLPIDDTFVCVLDASGDEGQAFDPCEFANACDPGLVCAGSASASECDPMATGCCVPMCSISGMTVCPGVGQECTSLYEEGMAPPAYADIGYCTLPV